MRDLITPGDIEYVRRQYPDRKIKMPSVSEQRILMLYMRGLSRPAIAHAMGEYMPTTKESARVTVSRFLSSDTAKGLIDLFREREFKDARVTRNHLTELLFESYHKAGSVLEEIAAIREIGKMNGLYESDKQAKGASVTINQVGNIQNVRQLERLSEAELSQLANNMGMVLDPEEVARKDLPKLPPTDETELPDAPREAY